MVGKAMQSDSIIWERTLLVGLGISVVLVAFPFVFGIAKVRFITELSILVLFGTAYNLTLGLTGLFSFGHGGLYGIGVYATVLSMITLGLPIFVALVGAPIVTAIVATGIGWFCLRLTGIYFSILTLAFSQLIWAFFWKWRSVTGGDDGIIGLQVPSLIASPRGMYFFVIGIVSVAMVIIWRIINSPMGFTLKMIRENPRRAESVGVDVKKYQLIAFIISSLFTGLAGSLMAIFIRGAFVEFASVATGFQPVFASVVGGLFSFAGPGIGAALLFMMDHYIGMFTEYWLFFAGAILILVMLFLPLGLVGSAKQWILERIKKSRNKEHLKGALLR